MGVVDVLAAVVGVVVLNDEGEERKNDFQSFFHTSFRNLRYSNHQFPLCHFVDKVDVVDTLPSALVPLVDCVDTDESRLSIGLRFAPDADWNIHGLRLLDCQCILNVGTGGAQVVDVRDGDGRKALIAVVSCLSHCHADLLRCRCIQSPVEIVGLREEFAVVVRETRAEVVSLVGCADLLMLDVGINVVLHRSLAAASHSEEVAQENALFLPLQCSVAEAF